MISITDRCVSKAKGIDLSRTIIISITYDVTNTIFTVVCYASLLFARGTDIEGVGDPETFLSKQNL